MAYSPHAPYEILQTRDIDFAMMQRMRRFSRYWDLVANSGNFLGTSGLLLRDRSPFQTFLHFSDWLFAKTRQTHAISLSALAEALFEFLTMELKLDPAESAQTIWRDYQRVGRSDRPAFLRPFVGPADTRTQPSPQAGHSRQQRHINA